MRIAAFPAALLFLLATACTAQTAVDRAAFMLDSLSSLGFNAWKMSPDLRGGQAVQGDPTQAGFDDSRWATLTLGERVYPDSCWLRNEIVLPATVLGQPVRGRVAFLVSLDDYGYLWVNGEYRGRFPWDGEFELTADARPGQRFLIAIKAVNTGGPLRLLRAELASDAVSPLRQELRDFALSLRVGQKLLGFDTYQSSAWRRTDPGIDRSTADRAEKERLNRVLQDAAARLDVSAVRRGDLDAFRASMAAVRKDLGPVRDYARRFTLFFNANAHIDAAWLWREAETVEVAKNTFSSVFNMMAQRPDFTYTQSAAVYYRWMQERYPAVFANIRKYVAEGRWEITGGMWVEPDCNLPAGVSWSRHLLYAKSYFRKELGTEVTIGWNPDSFGYNRNMPMFYRNAGIDAFVTQKIGWNDTNVFPHRLFWWESPDGSRILSYFPFDYVNTLEDPFRLVDWLRQYEANTGFRKLMVLFGVGNHGGGPSLEMLARIDRMDSLAIFPSIEHGTTAAYLAWLRKQDLGALPVWKDELYLEYHQGTFTTQASMKEHNRRGEELLTNAEFVSSLASLHGARYRADDLREAWTTLLFHQFHDILPGSSIREVYIDAEERLERAQAIGRTVLEGALRAVAERVNTSSARRGTPLLVFNTLAWERTDLVRHRLAPGDTGDWAVYDASGREIPSQVTGADRFERDLLFIARAVPAGGYALYELRRTPGGAPAVPPPAFGGTLENAAFRLTVDPDAGWIGSITDKRHGHEVLAGAGNRLQLLEDRPSAWDAWNIGLTGTEYPTAYRGAAIVERGPVRTVVRLRRDYLKPGVKRDYPTEDFPTSFFTQEVALYDALPLIEFTTRADWWEEKTMVKVAFPVSVRDSVATFEIPYGSITRSTQLRNSLDSAKVEVPALRWADLSAGGYGVSLLNRAKYGYDVKGNTLRLSLLRSPVWPDPTADRGKHTIEYALLPHAGSWREGGTVRAAIAYNTPLIAVTAGKHGGSLPPSASLVRLEPATLVLSSLKEAEDGDGWVVQWYDAAGTGAEAALTLPRAVKRAARSDFLETAGEPVAAAGSTLRVPTPAHGVVTLRVWFR